MQCVTLKILSRLHVPHYQHSHWNWNPICFLFLFVLWYSTNGDYNVTEVFLHCALRTWCVCVMYAAGFKCHVCWLGNTNGNGLLSIFVVLDSLHKDCTYCLQIGIRSFWQHLVQKWGWLQLPLLNLTITSDTIKLTTPCHASFSCDHIDIQ